MILQALKDREEAVSNGKLATIIFIRDRNARGQEVGRRHDMHWGSTQGGQLHKQLLLVGWDRREVHAVKCAPAVCMSLAMLVQPVLLQVGCLPAHAATHPVQGGPLNATHP